MSSTGKDAIEAEALAAARALVARAAEEGTTATPTVVEDNVKTPPGSAKRRRGKGKRRKHGRRRRRGRSTSSDSGGSSSDGSRSSSSDGRSRRRHKSRSKQRRMGREEYGGPPRSPASAHPEMWTPTRLPHSPGFGYASASGSLGGSVVSSQPPAGIPALLVGVIETGSTQLVTAMERFHAGTCMRRQGGGKQ